MASAVAGLRDYARECSAASSFEELTRYAVRAVHVTCGAKSTGYFQKFLATRDEIPFVALCGNGGEVLEGHRQKSDTIPHVMPAILDGLAVSESDLRRSPSAELRGRVEAGFTPTIRSLSWARTGYTRGSGLRLSNHTSPNQRKSVSWKRSLRSRN